MSDEGESNREYDDRQVELQRTRQIDAVLMRVTDYIKYELTMLVPEFGQRMANDVCHIIRKGLKR